MALAPSVACPNRIAAAWLVEPHIRQVGAGRWHSAHLECLATNSVATAGLSVGAIIGIVIGALVVAVVLALSGVVFARKMKHVARRSGDRNGAGVIGDVRL